MDKHFYTHLIDLSPLYDSLAQLDITEEEKNELYELAHSHIHHAIMDEILSQLNEEDKQKFIDHLSSDNHDQLWKHLNEQIESLEEKIIKTAHELRDELHQDIRDTKKNSK